MTIVDVAFEKPTDDSGQSPLREKKIIGAHVRKKRD
jgi:hypothetical protein